MKSFFTLLLLVAALTVLADASEEITAVGKPWTLTFELTVDSYPDHGRGFWDRESPMTLVVLDGGEGSRLLLRLVRKQLQLAAPAVNRQSVAAAVIEPGKGCSVRLESDGKVLRLRVNGHLLAVLAPGVPYGGYRTVLTGSDANGVRKLLGKIGRLQLQPGPLPLKKTGRKLPVRSVLTEGYPALRCADGVLHPWIDQLHIAAAAVPWFSPERRDLLAHGPGNAYGARLAVYRFLGLSPDKLPIYDSGTTVDDLPGSRFQCRPRRDGGFDLWAAGEASIYGSGALILLENKGKSGAPAFRNPTEVLVGGKRVSHALGGRWSGFYFGDLDGDGLEDLLIAKCYDPPENWSWPLGESAWSGRETRYVGKGKGYDVRGTWLGGRKVTELLWARGRRIGGGRAEFAPFAPVWFREKGTPFTWKSEAPERALALWRDPDGKRFLLHTGSVDELLAFPLHFDGREPVTGLPVPFLAAGPNLRETYFPLKLNIADLDGDGRPELLADGNPGKLVVMRGDRAGDFREAGCAAMRGGSLAGETLVSPWRVDLDGDGRPDLLLADASGYLTFWPGMSDPCVYGTPVRMHSDRKEIHMQAGYSGSIQGPNEKRWGYLNVAAGDWDGDGKPEILTCDITGTIRLYRSTVSPAGLTAPAEFTYHGTSLRAAWRTRPAILERRFRFGGRDAAALLLVDWDGDAAVGLPVAPGGFELERVVKLRYRDGRTVRVCGDSCNWGRSAVLPVDWDGDGKWDLLVGAPLAATPVIGGKLATRSTVFLLRNAGTDAEPVFESPMPLAGPDGKLLNFQIHNATPAIADLDGDGRPDLLVGAEDGKVYYFFHSGLHTRKERR